jgi:phosphoribosyl-AMP cyclohydrolase
MLAWMNAETLEATMRTGVMTFWSRSRQEIWVKGATSGNTQKLVKLERDCDGDSLLAIVEEVGPACHNGTESCFDSETLLDGGTDD